MSIGDSTSASYPAYDRIYDLDHVCLAHALDKPCSRTGRKYALNKINMCLITFHVRLITSIYGTSESELPDQGLVIITIINFNGCIKV